MERGEIYVGPFAYADAERSKARPQLVLSTGPFNNGPDVVAAMITSSGRRLAAPGPGDVVLVDWHEEGLPKPSTVRAGKLQTVTASRLTIRLGRLSYADMESVDRELRGVLGL
jgi:mRNA interferase MazF